MSIESITSHGMQAVTAEVTRRGGIKESESGRESSSAQKTPTLESEEIHSPEQLTVGEELAAVEDAGAVDNMNDFIHRVQRNLSFSVDEDTGHKVVRVIDAETDKVVRQMPSDEFLKLSRSLDSLHGVLFSDQA
ncbi:MAG: flagellar protein FlaG [Gammaproteobacteria bacterium]|nr:flagellar protein FlaG [Gammaproteobacteria bacterium]